MVGMSRAYRVVWEAMSLGRSLRRFVAERLLGRGVWGINGALHEELAERGTLGTRKIVKRASPGDPFGGPI